jgi:acetoin utilization deacetylase AcuC-like enzyme
LPLLERFEPELIIVSAGYDSHLSDSMSLLGLVEKSYWKIMLVLSVLCRWSCKDRLGIVLEGGYDHRSTADSVVSTISACQEEVCQACLM